MMVNKDKERIPTDEQTKELWEGCGWEYIGITNSATHGLVYAPRETWRHLYKPETTMTSPTTGKPRVLPASYQTFYAEKRGGSPPIDLNNLFEYAVPDRISEVTFMYASNCVSCDIEDLEGNFFEAHIDTESIKEAWEKTNLALFWVLYKVLKAKR